MKKLFKKIRRGFVMKLLSKYLNRNKTINNKNNEFFFQNREHYFPLSH